MKKITLPLIFLCFVQTLFSQDSSIVGKNAINSTVTIVGDSVLGSGFFIDDSIIATNYHVTKGAAKIFYSTNNSAIKYGIDGYVAVDKAFDLILLKVSGLTKPPVAIDTLRVSVGEKVYDISSSMIYDISGSMGVSSTISDGIVNAKLGLNGDTLFQITANIPYKGCGGPVLNSRGELIGISAIDEVGGHNLDIAIPVKYLERMLKNRSDYPASFSGLNVIPKTPVLAAKAYFREGLQKFLYGDYQGALPEFNNAVNLYPKDTEAFEFLGITSLLLNDNITAINNFEQVLLLNPGNEDAFYHLGVARRRIEDYTNAINDFDTVIKHNPNYAEAYLHRGLAEVKVDNFEEAQQDFVQAINLTPAFWDTYITDALRQERLEYYRSALRYLGLARGEDPNRFLVFFLRGYAYLRVNNKPASVTAYEHGFFYATTHDVNVAFYCGLAKYKLGDYKTALQYFDKATTTDSRYTDAFYYHALVNTILGYYPSAIKDYDNVTILNPNFAKAWFNRGVLKYKTGDKEGACSDWKKAKKLGDKNAEQLIKENCQK